MRQSELSPDVPYTAYWIRWLVRASTVYAVQVGDRVRGTWLVHLPSLLEYIKKTDELGTQKHYPDYAGRDE